MPDPTAELIDWIDEQGRVIEVLPRGEIRRRNLLHAVTATLVFHPDGRLFCQQRTMTKDVYPGYHDVMVGGTVTSGETFAETACREICEELGVRGVPVYFLLHHRYQDAHTNSLIHLFACRHPGPMTLQAEEVAGGYWLDPEEIPQRLLVDPFCPDSAEGWRLFLEAFGSVGELFRRMDGSNGGTLDGTGDDAVEGSLKPIDCNQWVEE